MRNLSYYQSVFGVMLLSYVISGCATPPTHNPDPFENFNRGVFAFNEGVDQIVVKPVAETYKGIVPDPVDRGVTNFFSNLDDIVVIANDLLQFKFKQAASDSGRFFINSTVGLLGFIDVGTELGLSKHNEDFGQTLGYWGIKSGPYLVLPFLGFSSTRDVVGLGTDLLLEPTFYYATSITSSTGQAILAGEAIKGVDTRADALELDALIQTAALDKYSYIRDAYLARREYLVYDGNPPLEDDDEEEDEEEDDLFNDEEEDELVSEDDDEDELVGNDDEITSENDTTSLNTKRNPLHDKE
ncbi:MAG: VacJ family lipoprotein [Gammaproteobacteria bacterium]|nr:MAG: VacJ family lipoprotein [Gammaproteobacteria bacterium]